MKKVLKSRLPELWEAINNNFDLFLPMENGTLVNFGSYTVDKNVRLDVLKTNSSVKEFVFPQTETYLKFKNTRKKLELTPVNVVGRDYVLFGVRNCDAASFKIMDNIFLREPVDTYYRAHREKGIIVTMACNSPEETCFCSAFGIDAAEASPASDIVTWDMGDYILWETKSEKGEKLTASVSSILEEAEDISVLEILKKEIKEKMESLPLRELDPKKITKEQQELFDMEDFWGDISKKCLACGSCTFVCPTCHCYDVKDYDGGNAGERYRCWDSCMISDFTRMAHGNPRTNQLQRVRQRFMHKLVYYPKNHEGMYSCVGCGRCVEKCPVGLNIVRVIKRLGEE
ncbi:4Fe-4S dicluster domain-containing protein [uncultured Fusobacterium sp.]|uniref:4Fe-4S dicluster domain-containing protein n=1 Tax=uncultured Fusobacterium sp. TaxID=159267 RepID=UPI0027DB4E1A|nr:4Fe-4S dicluster domain-containing protein [uncultured Fusobacterium sp.]